jgi:hypothetical protein
MYIMLIMVHKAMLFKYVLIVHVSNILRYISI